MHQSNVSKREVDNCPMWTLTSTLQGLLFYLFFLKKREDNV